MHSQKPSVNYGPRTQKDILKDKRVRKDEDGVDFFEDYWTDSDDSPSYTSESVFNSNSKRSSEKSHLQPIHSFTVPKASINNDETGYNIEQLDLIRLNESLKRDKQYDNVSKTNFSIQKLTSQNPVFDTGQIHYNTRSPRLSFPEKKKTVSNRVLKNISNDRENLPLHNETIEKTVSFKDKGQQHSKGIEPHEVFCSYSRESEDIDTDDNISFQFSSTVNKNKSPHLKLRKISSTIEHISPVCKGVNKHNRKMSPARFTNISSTRAKKSFLKESNYTRIIDKNQERDHVPLSEKSSKYVASKRNSSKVQENRSTYDEFNTMLKEMSNRNNETHYGEELHDSRACISNKGYNVYVESNNFSEGEQSSHSDISRTYKHQSEKSVGFPVKGTICNESQNIPRPLFSNETFTTKRSISKHSPGKKFISAKFIPKSAKHSNILTSKIMGNNKKITEQSTNLSTNTFVSLNDSQSFFSQPEKDNLKTHLVRNGFESEIDKQFIDEHEVSHISSNDDKHENLKNQTFNILQDKSKKILNETFCVSPDKNNHSSFQYKTVTNLSPNSNHDDLAFSRKKHANPKGGRCKQSKHHEDTSFNDLLETNTSRKINYNIPKRQPNTTLENKSSKRSKLTGESISEDDFAHNSECQYPDNRQTSKTENVYAEAYEIVHAETFSQHSNEEYQDSSADENSIYSTHSAASVRQLVPREDCKNQEKKNVSNNEMKLTKCLPLENDTLSSNCDFPKKRLMTTPYQEPQKKIKLTMEKIVSESIIGNISGSDSLIHQQISKNKKVKADVKEYKRAGLTSGHYLNDEFSNLSADDDSLYKRNSVTKMGNSVTVKESNKKKSIPSVEVRKSQRQRFPPLDHWRNQRIKYCLGGDTNNVLEIDDGTKEDNPLKSTKESLSRKPSLEANKYRIACEGNTLDHYSDDDSSCLPPTTNSLNKGNSVKVSSKTNYVEVYNSKRNENVSNNDARKSKHLKDVPSHMTNCDAPKKQAETASKISKQNAEKNIIENDFVSNSESESQDNRQFSKYMDVDAAKSEDVYLEDTSKHSNKESLFMSKNYIDKLKDKKDRKLKADKVDKSKIISNHESRNDSSHKTKCDASIKQARAAPRKSKQNIEKNIIDNNVANNTKSNNKGNMEVSKHRNIDTEEFGNVAYTHINDGFLSLPATNNSFDKRNLGNKSLHQKKSSLQALQNDITHKTDSVVPKKQPNTEHVSKNKESVEEFEVMHKDIPVADHSADNRNSVSKSVPHKKSKNKNRPHKAKSDVSKEQPNATFKKGKLNGENIPEKHISNKRKAKSQGDKKTSDTKEFEIMHEDIPVTNHSADNRNSVSKSVSHKKNKNKNRPRKAISDVSKEQPNATFEKGKLNGENITEIDISSKLNYKSQGDKTTFDTEEFEVMHEDIPVANHFANNRNSVSKSVPHKKSKNKNRPHKDKYDVSKEQPNAVLRKSKLNVKNITEDDISSKLKSKGQGNNKVADTEEFEVVHQDITVDKRNSISKTVSHKNSKSKNTPHKTKSCVSKKDDFSTNLVSKSLDNRQVSKSEESEAKKFEVMHKDMAVTNYSVEKQKSGSKSVSHKKRKNKHTLNVKVQKPIHLQHLENNASPKTNYNVSKNVESEEFEVTHDDIAVANHSVEERHLVCKSVSHIQSKTQNVPNIKVRRSIRLQHLENDASYKSDSDVSKKNPKAVFRKKLNVDENITEDDFPSNSKSKGQSNKQVLKNINVDVEEYENIIVEHHTNSEFLSSLAVNDSVKNRNSINKSQSDIKSKNKNVSNQEVRKSNRLQKLENDTSQKTYCDVLKNQPEAISTHSKKSKPSAEENTSQDYSPNQNIVQVSKNKDVEVNIDEEITLTHEPNVESISISATNYYINKGDSNNKSLCNKKSKNKFNCDVSNEQPEAASKLTHSKSKTNDKNIVPGDKSKFLNEGNMEISDNEDVDAENSKEINLAHTSNEDSLHTSAADNSINKENSDNMVNKPISSKKNKGKKSKRKENMANGEIRKSTRQKFPPLAHWRNERVMYCLENGGIKVLGVNKGTKADNKALESLERQLKNSHKLTKTVPFKKKSVYVFDTEQKKKVKLDVMKRFPVLAWESFVEDQPFRVKHAFGTTYADFGYIEINCFDEMPSQVLAKQDVHLTVIKGSIEVLIQKSRFQVAAKDMFIVPCNTAYGIRNLSIKKSLISFATGKFKVTNSR